MVTKNSAQYAQELYLLLNKNSSYIKERKSITKLVTDYRRRNNQNNFIIKNNPKG